MTSKAALQIVVEGDASDAVDSFDKVTSSARSMGDTVESASRQADDSAARMGGAADAADHMASSSSQAAGGLGDLGGALSLMPGPLGAMGAGMEAAAPAIMGVTGAADLMNLAMNSSVVTTTRARAAAIAHRVSSVAQAAATRTVTIAQRAMNLAMRANPVGLLVTAVFLLVGAFVLLYRRSETVRNAVDKVGSVARAAGGVVRDAFSRVIDVIGNVIDKVQAVVTVVREKLGGAFGHAKDLAVDAFAAIVAPIQKIIDKVQDLINWLSKIDIPDLPGWIPGVGRTTVGSAPGVVGGTGDTVQIYLPLLSTLNDATIGQLVAALTEFYRRRGMKIQVVAA